MTQTQSTGKLKAWPDMPRGVLAALLDLSGLAGPMSPRHVLGKASELTLDQLVELYAADVLSTPRETPDALTPAFHSVAATLRAPRLNVTVRVFRSDGACIESNVQFPGPAFDGRGVVINQIGGRYRLASFADDRAVLDLIGDAIPRRFAGPLLPFEALLEPVQALVMGTVFDLVAANGGGPVTLTGIDADLSERWGLTSFDALVTCLMVAAGMPGPPSRPQIEAAAANLIALDLLAEASGSAGFVPGSAAEPLAGFGSALTSGLQWQRASEEAGQLVLSNRLFLFDGSGRALAITRGSRGRVHLATLDDAALLDFVSRELATSAVVPVPS